jgi:uncharacterized protein YaaN involved in tellurite resistance
VTNEVIKNETESESDTIEEVEIIPVDVRAPRAPTGMSDEEAQQVRREASALVDQLAHASGSGEFELLDDISNVGLTAQQRAASQMGLLKTSIGSLLSEGGASKEIANGLRDLRLALNAVNPHELTGPSIRDRIVGVLPFGGKQGPLVRRLNKIALRYEPASRQAAAIEAKLRDGRAMLVRDNAELRQMYEEVEAHQLSVQRNAYAGEVLMQRLGELIEQTEDPAKLERVRGAMFDVTIRVQDLRLIEEVHLQYFASMELTRQNNHRLGQSVERTLALATNVVTVGLAVQAALVRQQRVADAAQRTREFLGDLVAANASTIRQHTEDIGDLYRSPVIAIEKLSQAHDDLVEALGAASRMQQEGIDSGRESIARLTEMSADLEQKVSGLLPAREAIESGTAGSN